MQKGEREFTFLHFHHNCVKKGILEGIPLVYNATMFYTCKARSAVAASAASFTASE